MYPGRFWAALGTGEASNEHITGGRLAAQGRPQRPAARVRRRHPGAARAARRSATTAWSPSTGPGCGPGRRSRLQLIGAAVSVADRRLGAAEWADGLITVNAAGRAPPPDDRRLPGRRRPRRRSCLQVHVSWAPTQDEADGDRARAVAQQRLRAAGLLGPGDRRALRRGLRGRDAGAGRQDRPRLAPTWAGTPRSAAPSTWSSASTRSTCTTSGRSRTSSSTRSAPRSCRS